MAIFLRFGPARGRGSLRGVVDQSIGMWALRAIGARIGFDRAEAPAADRVTPAADRPRATSDVRPLSLAAADRRPTAAMPPSADKRPAPTSAPFETTLERLDAVGIRRVPRSPAGPPAGPGRPPTGPAAVLTARVEPERPVPPADPPRRPMLGALPAAPAGPAEPLRRPSERQGTSIVPRASWFDARVNRPAGRPLDARAGSHPTRRPLDAAPAQRSWTALLAPVATAVTVAGVVLVAVAALVMPPRPDGGVLGVTAAPRATDSARPTTPSGSASARPSAATPSGPAP